jgi:hypothetical protein
MSISNEIHSLKEYSSGSRNVLSMYLNTNPGDHEQTNGAWKIHLKNGMKDLEKFLAGSDKEEELKSFQGLKKKVISEIEDNKEDLHKGVVIFASDNPELWSVHYVQVPVKKALIGKTSRCLNSLNTCIKHIQKQQLYYLALGKYASLIRQWDFFGTIYHLYLIQT